MEVNLTQPVSVEEVDDEIVVVAGCALGFVAPKQPPHVLHVDPGTETASYGIQSDDLLVSIDGQDTRSMVQAEMAKLLKVATKLMFERPKATDASEGQKEAEERPRATATPEVTATEKARSRRSRSRSRRRQRNREARHAEERSAAAPPESSAPPPPSWTVERPPTPGWPAPGAPGGPPLHWMGNAPPPWALAPPPHLAYGSRPPDTWRGPVAAPLGPPPGQLDDGQHRRDGRRGPRPERNESGGASIVAERVPPSVNNMDVLNEYFARFGPVSSLQINQMRHEAIVTFARFEDAEQALRWPVLNDPSIGLRPWKGRAGQRMPIEAPVELEVHHPIAPPGNFGERKAPALAQNMVIECGEALQKKRKAQEIEERRRMLLQGLTDQLKTVMARISDPATSERNREQLQGILASIKEKITTLTPQQAPPPKRMPLIPIRPPIPFQTKLDNRRQPASLKLSSLPAELHGPENEARLIQALGDGVETVHSYSEDGSSCVVRFSDRRLAKAAIQAQKVWGYVADLHGEEPILVMQQGYRPRVKRHFNKVYKPPPMEASQADDERVPGSPETEAFDSDVSDDELNRLEALAAEEHQKEIAEDAAKDLVDTSSVLAVAEEITKESVATEDVQSEVTDDAAKSTEAKENGTPPEISTTTSQEPEPVPETAAPAQTSDDPSVDSKALEPATEAAAAAQAPAAEPSEAVEALEALQALEAAESSEAAQGA
jgi:hypothetical protein